MPDVLIIVLASVPAFGLALLASELAAGVVAQSARDRRAAAARLLSPR